MKIVKINLIFKIILILILLSSCSVEKRIYLSGFHITYKDISLNKKSKKNINQEIKIIVTPIVEEVENCDNNNIIINKESFLCDNNKNLVLYDGNNPSYIDNNAALGRDSNSLNRNSGSFYSSLTTNKNLSLSEIINSKEINKLKKTKKNNQNKKPSKIESFLGNILLILGGFVLSIGGISCYEEASHHLYNTKNDTAFMGFFFSRISFACNWLINDLLWNF